MKHSTDEANLKKKKKNNSFDNGLNDTAPLKYYGSYLFCVEDSRAIKFYSGTISLIDLVATNYTTTSPLS